MGVLYGPAGWRFLMGEVPLYTAVASPFLASLLLALSQPLLSSFSSSTGREW